MQSKTLAAITYVTIIGWVYAWFQYKNGTEKSPLVRYHLEQSLGLNICALILGVAVGIIASIIPALSLVLSIVSAIPFILMILGIITALNEVSKPVPVIGSLFENKFAFLNN